MTDCPRCGTTIQRTMTGTLADGMRAHYQTVHPGVPLPRGLTRTGTS